MKGSEVRFLPRAPVMLLTPHVAVGAAIGASTENLTYIIVLAFMSHFILDALPHTDWGTWHEYKDFVLEKKDYILLLADVICILILIYILWDNILSNQYIVLGMFFAILVDLIDNVPFWKYNIRKLPVFSQLHKFHRLFHFKIKPNYWQWGVLTQIAVIIISLFVVFKN